MKIKFCLPIIAGSMDQVKKMISKNSGYDFYEIWIDYLKENLDVILREINTLNETYPDKLIVCFRRQMGDSITKKFDERKKIIDALNGLGIMMDFDISKQKQDLEFLKESKLTIKTIISYHDYEQTPENKDLLKIIESMQIYNPDIYKVATFCKNFKDAVRLMYLLVQLKKQGKKVIIIGMGEFGKITRIFGATIEQEINFVASSNHGASAPGQLTKEELEKIISILNS